MKVASRVDYTYYRVLRSLTPQQASVVDYLYSSGWASPRSIAFYLYNDRSQAGRAAGIAKRLEEKGLVEPYLTTAVTLTPLARGYMKKASEHDGEQAESDDR